MIYLLKEHIEKHPLHKQPQHSATWLTTRSGIDGRLELPWAPTVAPQLPGSGNWPAAVVTPPRRLNCFHMLAGWCAVVNTIYSTRSHTFRWRIILLACMLCPLLGCVAFCGLRWQQTESTVPRWHCGTGTLHSTPMPHHPPHSNEIWPWSHTAFF